MRTLDLFGKSKRFSSLVGAKAVEAVQICYSSSSNTADYVEIWNHADVQSQCTAPVLLLAGLPAGVELAVYAPHSL